jgi:hypothetical protein
MFGLSAFSQVPFSSLAGEIKLAIASITCNATMEVNIENVVQGIVNIVTSTTVSALGNLVLSGKSSITALATVAVSARAVYSAITSINGTGTVTAKGFKQGEEWTTVPPGTDTWLQQG